MSVKTGGVAVRDGFDPAPAAASIPAVAIEVATAVPPTAEAVGVLVATDGPVPAELGHDRAALRRAGFDGKPGQVLVLPTAGGPPVVAVGTGPSVDVDGLRDAAGAFARAAGPPTRLAVVVPAIEGVSPAHAGQVVTEGVLLARYRYHVLQSKAEASALEALTLVGDEELATGIDRGRVLARACGIARDLANCPPAHLTAVAMAAVAERLGGAAGLGVEVFDEPALWDLGCGGLLGVNAGSHDEPRMIKLTYRPDGEPTGHLTPGRQGDHVRLRGHQPEARRRHPRHDEERHVGGGAVLAAMTVAAGDRLPHGRHRLPDVHRQHAVGHGPEDG